jgi:Bacterial Ig domain/Bacterial Ig-like domain
MKELHMPVRPRSLLAVLPVLLALVIAPSASAHCGLIDASVMSAKNWYGLSDPPPTLLFDIADDERSLRDYANEATGAYFVATQAGSFGWTVTPPWSTYTPGTNPIRAALFCLSGTQVMRAFVNYDPYAPTVAWSSPAADQWIRGSVALQVVGQDGLSGIDHFVLSPSTGALVSSADGTATLDTTGLPDGPRALTATAVDRAGNRSDVATRTVKVDNSVPLVSLDAPGAATLVSGSLALAATASDAGSGVGQVRFELRPAAGGAWSPLGADGDAPYRIVAPALVADGAYEVRAVAADALGNEAASPGTAIVIDRTAPAATLDTVAATVSGTIALTAIASDTGSGVARVEFQVAPTGSDAWEPIASLDSAPWKARFATADVSDGTYALRVLVRDRAGNELGSALRQTTVHNAVEVHAAGVTAPAAIADAAKKAVALRAQALPRRVEGGRTIVVRGTAPGVSLGLVTVTLQDVRLPKLVQRVRGITLRDGSFRVTLRPRFSGRVRIVFAGDATHRSATADAGVVRVHPRLVVQVTGTRASDGSLVDPHVRGRLVPGGAPVRLVWQARPAHGGAWLLFCRSKDQISVGRNGIIDGVCHVSGLHADNRYRLVVQGGADASYLPAVTKAMVARPTG